MKKIPIKNIQAKAKFRPVGYLEEVMASGRINGDYVEFDEEVFYALRQKYIDPLEPSLPALARNFTAATARWVAAGFPVVSEEIFKQRSHACNACEFWDANARMGLGKCQACGCTSLKWWVETEKCPNGVW